MIALVAYIMLGIAGIAFAIACVPRSAWSRIAFRLRGGRVTGPAKWQYTGSSLTVTKVGRLSNEPILVTLPPLDPSPARIHLIERDASGMPTRIEAYRARGADVQRSIDASPTEEPQEDALDVFFATREWRARANAAVMGDEWDDVTPAGKVEVIR